jgi:hypothetical protein
MSQDSMFCRQPQPVTVTFEGESLALEITDDVPLIIVTIED